MQSDPAREPPMYGMRRLYKTKQIPPSGQGQKRQGNAHPDHQGTKRRIETVLHRHDGASDHWRHCRLEERDLYDLAAGAHHAAVEQRQQEWRQQQLESKPCTER